ncbi:MAG TPA: diacylglycerol kinase family protein [Chitinophagaceae bacterium]|nr:diacylglycerol kinase family protein [Chitinophagaceae bacterium]
MIQQSFSWRRRGESFRYAFAGLRTALRTEHNMWLHFAATIGVISLSIAYSVTLVEAGILIISISLVWMAELFNTCIEKMMDFISTDKHPKIKLIKDLSAAAVLIGAIASLVMGCIIFIPKIFPG